MIDTTRNNKRSSNSLKSSDTNAAARPRAEFKQHNGKLALFIDGRPRVPVCLNVTTESDHLAIKEAVGRGATIARVCLEDLCWNEPGRLNIEIFDERMKKMLNDLPTLSFFLAINMDAPAWWLRQNPKEKAEYGLPVRNAEPMVSWASQLWRQQAGEALDRLIKCLYRTGLSARCLGIELQAGQGGAWAYPNPQGMPDTGLCMRDAFKQYVLAKYRRNEGLLRKAWFDARAEFASINCPDPAQRGKSDYGVFRNPHHSRRLIDYYEALALAQTDTMSHFAGIVKRASQGALLVGFPSLKLDGVSATAESGHSIPAPLLESGDVDYFVESQDVGSTGVFKPYRDSLALHNKFVFLSTVHSDIAIVLQAHAQGIGSIIEMYGKGNYLDDLAEAVLAIERLPARSVKKGAGSQVAVILDPGSGLVVGHRTDAAPILTLIQDQISAFSRCGVSISYYSYADLFNNKFPDHMVVLLPDCFYMTEAERRKLDARVKRTNQTVVWFWAPGMIGEESISADNGTKCCGQKVRIEPGGVSLRTRLILPNDPLTWGRHAGDMFGAELSTTPTCTVADKKSTRLGSNSGNKTTFAVRRFDTWTSVVFGTLPVPLDLLQNVFRAAGCHIYCTTLREGDSLYTDGRTLSISSKKGGTYPISLPGIFDVLNVVTGEKAVSAESDFTVTLRSGATALFDLKPLPSSRPHAGVE